MIKKIKKYTAKTILIWKNYYEIKKLSKENKELVLYAETIADWAFINPIAINLEKKNIKYIKITSDYKDTNLSGNKTYFIGYGLARTMLFRTILTKGFIMTLTDLNTFHLKRSIYNVHYFYFFHSLASTHRVYRENAFNAYDTIFCTGDYQIKEIRKTEKIYNLNKKNLVKCGYPRLDSLIKKKTDKKNLQKKIIISPTWGKSSLINTHLDNLINILIKENFFVSLRLHPMTLRHQPKIIKKIIKKYFENSNFFYDKNINNEERLMNNDIMISEWSGAALEFAFASNKPVIFINTKPKTNNINWKKIKLPCFEEEIRDKIGKTISENEINKIPNIIDDLHKKKSKWSKEILKIRKEKIYNIGKSSDYSTDIILKTLKIE